MSASEDRIATIARELAGRITDDRLEGVEALSGKNYPASAEIAKTLRLNTSGNIETLQHDKSPDAANGFLTGMIMTCWALALYHVELED